MKIALTPKISATELIGECCFPAISAITTTNACEG